MQVGGIFILKIKASERVFLFCKKFEKGTVTSSDVTVPFSKKLILTKHLYRYIMDVKSGGLLWTIKKTYQAI
jgi:hypothetical protein